MIVNRIKFPKYTGIKCNMMPFVQGDSSSLPEIYQSYADIINENYLEKGEIGFLTIDESLVEGGKSQRGYNDKGINRNVHIEVGQYEGRRCWHHSPKTILDITTKVLIANSISDTCKYWANLEKRYTKDGDLSEYISDYPIQTGNLLKAGELAKISIFTPHECIAQKESAQRQFFRIVGNGVRGREDYFTTNPLVSVHTESV